MARRKSFVVTFAVALGFVGGADIAPAAADGSPPTPTGQPVSSVDANPLPAAPSAAAPRSAWEAWAADQQASMRSAKWDELAPSGCHLENLEYIPVSGASGIKGMPADITTLAVAGVISCDPKSVPVPSGAQANSNSSASGPQESASPSADQASASLALSRRR